MRREFVQRAARCVNEIREAAYIVSRGRLRAQDFTRALLAATISSDPSRSEVGLKRQPLQTPLTEASSSGLESEVFTPGPNSWSMERQ